MTFLCTTFADKVIFKGSTGNRKGCKTRLFARLDFFFFALHLIETYISRGTPGLFKDYLKRYQCVIVGRHHRHTELFTQATLVKI